MKTTFKRAAITPLLLAGAFSAQAATWEIDPNESVVTFEYSYEGTPYQGQFTNIDATFDIDPMNPGSCEFTVEIPIAKIGRASCRERV